MTRICLLHLPMRITGENRFDGNWPLSLGYLQAYLRKNGHSVDVLDLSSIGGGWRLISAILSIRSSYQIVGITSYSGQEQLIAFAARLIRTRSTKVVVGGVGASLDPDWFASSSLFDAVVVGEGEEAMLDIVRQYESTGRIAGSVFRSTILQHNLDYYGPIERRIETHIVSPDVLAYNIMFGRGCMNSCSFCVNSSPNLRYSIRHHSTDYIVKDIERMLRDSASFGFRGKTILVSFADLSFFHNFRTSAKLLLILSRLDKRIRFKVALTTQTLTDHIDSLVALARYVRLTVEIGVENVSSRVQATYNKRFDVHSVARNLGTLVNFVDSVVLNMICFTPDVSIDEIRENYAWIANLGYHESRYNMFINPYTTELRLEKGLRVSTVYQGSGDHYYVDPEVRTLVKYFQSPVIAEKQRLLLRIRTYMLENGRTLFRQISIDASLRQVMSNLLRINIQLATHEIEFAMKRCPRLRFRDLRAAKRVLAQVQVKAGREFGSRLNQESSLQAMRVRLQGYCIDFSVKKVCV